MFGLSKREIENKFKRSELALLAWRSQEISAQLEKSAGTSQSSASGRRPAMDAGVPENLPDRFYNEHGEIDLRKVTGEEAYRFMSLQGIKLPIMGRRDGK